MIGDKGWLFVAVTAAAALFVADALFNWTIFYTRNPTELPGSRTSYSAVGRVFRVFFGGMLLLALLSVGARELLHRGGSNTVQGWSQPMKLERGEQLRSAAVASDDTVVAVTSGGLVERGGNWLYRIDSRGRLLSGLMRGSALSIDEAGPRALAWDDVNDRVLIATSVSDVETQSLGVRAFDRDGKPQGQLLTLAVPRPKVSAGTAAAGDVALSAGPDGQTIIVGRADAPGSGSAQLSVFRAGLDGRDPEYGGDLTEVPVRSDGAVAVVRGPSGSVYVTAGDGAGTWVMRLTATGRLDPTFGQSGIVKLEGPGNSIVTATPSGMVIAGIVGGYRFSMRKVGWDGAIDDDFAAGLRRTPLSLRQGELTHAAGIVFASGTLIVALYSFDSRTGRTQPAIVVFSERGEQLGEPSFLEGTVPEASSVAARGLWLLGADRMLLGVEAGPATPSATTAPTGRRDVYLCPLRVSDFSGP